MRNKFIRTFRKNLMSSKIFNMYDIDEIVHLANISYKKCKKDYKDYKRKLRSANINEYSIYNYSY